MAIRWAAFLAGFFVSVFATAQPINVPNGDFNQDAEGWSLSGGTGGTAPADGGANPAITVTGAGTDSNYWRSPEIAFEPSTRYALRFTAKSASATTGTAISGPVFCNRDLGTLSDAWQRIDTVFTTPAHVDAENAWLRFGQWQMNGTVLFDNIALCRSQPVYARFGDIELGAGESIIDGHYTCRALQGESYGNTSRALFSYECGFNTYRWVFASGSEVTYSHRVGSRKQTRGSVRLRIGNYCGGAVAVHARRGDDDSWTRAGLADAEGSKTIELDPALFPSTMLQVRLVGETIDGATASLQVEDYTYEADLDGSPIMASGATQELSVLSDDPRFTVTFESLGDLRPGGTNELAARVQNAANQDLTLPAVFTITGEDHVAETFRATWSVPAGKEVRVNLPYEVRNSGPQIFNIAVDEQRPDGFRATTLIDVPALYSTSYGESLPGSSDAVGLWWASSGWKVSRERPLPAKVGSAVHIRAARNEADAAQLVIRPTESLANLTVSADDLVGAGGAIIPSSSIDLLRVRYVDVVRPTDSTGVAAPWPDPLPPFRGPIDVAAGTNQPIWVRLNVPADAAPGLYGSTIHIAADNYVADVPLRVEVYGFTLPTRPTCVTTFGFSPGLVFNYQHVTDPQQQRDVLDRYWQNFSAHRIAPYHPAALDPFEVTWPGADAWKNGQEKDVQKAFTPQIDWAGFDRAMTTAIDQYGFNSFIVPIVGMGGGTFHSRTEPSLLGYGEDTPEYQVAFTNYCQQVQEHLREKGWLDEAYLYWFDEPDPKDYEFVMNGFRKVHEAAPDINRMLTEQVEPALIGGPNIWCPISNAFDMEDAQARRAEGEKFWWYVCTGPKAPYCTLFIDHPATELRAWLWQTWQRKIDGILVWQSNYWTSDAAYPDAPQNPYADPMGWTSGYSTPAGTKRPWGNGDGRFIYPPETAADGLQTDTVLDGPVDSIRWEMLRDGVEDYEYLAILRDLTEEAAKAGVEDEALAEYQVLLEVPDDITASMTAFTTDPAPIELRRDAVARAIDRLRSIPALASRN